MNIEGLGSLIPKTIEVSKPKEQVTENFGATFTDLIKDANQDQLDSKKMVEGFVSGEGIQLHEVMIAGEKAKTSLQLLMEIRNKTVDMFKELTRISV